MFPALTLTSNSSAIQYFRATKSSLVKPGGMERFFRGFSTSSLGSGYTGRPSGMGILFIV
jgi:hypothetical protein